MSKSTKQYLERHAADEAQRLHGWPAHFHHAMLIPAKDEKPSLIDNCQQFLEKQSNTLLVLIINQADNTNSTTENKKLWQHGINSGPTLWRKDHLCLVGWKEGSALLLIDRFSPGLQLPTKEGVGLARKIAADIISQLIDRQHISQPWIFSSDADCQWPANYFRIEQTQNENQAPSSRHQGPSKTVAAHFNFHHCTSKDTQLDNSQKKAINEATALYEQSLHYYREGLQWANSPYDFYTIGSCLRIHYEAYCQVRGFPCRAAGEDFYLLNKLAKLGNIDYLHKQTIQIESRVSQRAPFGTGPAVLEIIRQEKTIKNFDTYHPMCFAELKKLLSNCDAYAYEKLDDSLEETLESNAISKALYALGIDKFKRHLQQQNCSADRFDREFHTWFDAFRTLKFIHYMRDNVYPNIALGDAFEQLRQWS